MSANTILSNSQFLQQLSTSLNLITPTTGITVLDSGNNNIATEVVGNTGTITLATDLDNLNLVSTNTLEVATFANPFYLNQPAQDGYVLSSETNGALSWIPQSGGGGGGITGLQTTNVNLSASATSDPAIWLLGLNSTLSGMVQITAENIGVSNSLTLLPDANGIDMNNAPIINTSMTNPFKTAPTADGQVLASTIAGALSWVSQGGGGGGITTINTTNANLTAVATADPAVWEIGLNQTLQNMDLITTANLLITSSTNPFAVTPTENGYVLACSTDNIVSWVPQTGGGGGITTINTTDANLTAVPTANPAVWEIGLSSVVTNLNSLTAEVLYCGNGAETGLQVSAGSGGIFMNATQLGQVNYIGNYSTDPSTVVDIFSNWNVGANSWGGEVYMDDSGVYITTNSATKNLYYSPAGDLANYATSVSYPPTTNPTWTIANGGDATLATAVFTSADENATAVKLNAGNLDMGNNEIIGVNQIVSYSTAPSPDIKVRSNVDTVAGTYGGELYMDSTGVYLTTNTEANKLWLGNDASISVFNIATPFPPVSAPLWGVDGAGLMTIPSINAKTNISLITGATLNTNNMTNPFADNPVSSGQVLSSDINGNLSWINNGSGSSAGSLVSLGQQYTPLNIQINQQFVYLIGTASLGSLATLGMPYYINLSNYTVLNNNNTSEVTIGIYLNGADPNLGGTVASAQSYYLTGSYTTLNSILQYSVQNLSDSFAVWVGALGAELSTVTGGSYTITGII
jgi:hypothetical protein